MKKAQHKLDFFDSLSSPSRGTTLPFALVAGFQLISIHVPREGDDSEPGDTRRLLNNFNPRPP